MIPSFEPSGLLPPGIHDASWDEVVGRLGVTESRRRLLMMARPALTALGAAGCASAYLAGSFVTTKPDPQDIDVLWDPAGVDGAVLRGHDPLLEDDSPPGREIQVRRYGAEFIPSTVPRSGLSYIDFFQTHKPNDAPKGIVRLDPRALTHGGSGTRETPAGQLPWGASLRSSASGRGVLKSPSTSIFPGHRETRLHMLAGEEVIVMANQGAWHWHHHHRCPPGTFPYTVQQGDTYYLLAQRFGTTVSAIKAANPGVDWYNLQPGQVICIPKAPPPTTCPPGTFPYTVQQGDTYYLLAQRFGTTVAAIKAANPGVDWYNLQPGQVICIPSGAPPTTCPPGTFPYTVQQGDTFYLLAQRFGTTVAAIQAANPGVDPYNLQPGQVICIPSS